MHPRIAPLVATLRLNSRLYRNCLAGLDDAAAQQRVQGAGATNSAAFVAAHLVDSRHYLLSLVGDSTPSPLKGAEGGFNDIAAVTSYPPLAEILAAWDRAGQALETRLAALAEADLNRPLGEDWPIEEKTLHGVLVFMVQHESYHLGQLGFLRKHAGLPAMAYT
jgi:uncharacterized damage-inducible protein DinB